MWDLIVSVPDHCLSFYFGFMVQCFLVKGNSLLLINGSFFLFSFFFSFFHQVK